MKKYIVLALMAVVAAGASAQDVSVNRGRLHLGDDMSCAKPELDDYMDEAYHQKRYHFVQSLWGMLIGLIPCLVGSALYTLLFC